eukprot:2873170-Pleurochrysis_carterae.AAC.1
MILQKVATVLLKLSSSIVREFTGTAERIICSPAMVAAAQAAATAAKAAADAAAAAEAANANAVQSMTASADASASSKMACDSARRVEAFTQAVLTFWHCQAEAELKAWKTAARIVFAMTCTSAASERVFALLANRFGEKQHHTLSDQIQASLMLKYNKRSL